MLPSGLFEITGRVGAMIKVRGYSIVPGKVENEIIKQLAVSHCAVVADGEGLERQLVAYVVQDKKEPGNRTQLVIDDLGYSPVARRMLLGSLAQYMIPVVWIELDEIPTHAVSGKVDLKSLPSPSASRTASRTVSRAPSRPASRGGVETSNVKKSDLDKSLAITIEDIAKIWALSLKTSPSAITSEHDFFDLGGHSLTLADLASRLSKIYGCPVPLAGLVTNPTLEGHLKVVRSARAGYTASVQADLPAILREDSVLAEEVQSSGAAYRSLADADTVLLTGATGFLGAFLLADLVENTSAQIICLVRFQDSSEYNVPMAIARLRRNLLDLGLWKDSLLHRIEFLPGNLSRKRLGLSPDDFDALAERVQVIVHAGATVNLVYPYAALREANVGGTREMIRLAAKSGATLQYVSTNGVLPPCEHSWDETAMLDIESVPEKLPDGYGQTKWVAEQLVHEAGHRGIPVRIIRLGTISAHSVSGSTNAWDLFTALIVESLHLGFAPEIDGWRAEMTPVDYVSKAILTLAEKTNTKQTVFHIGDANPVQTQDLFNHLAVLGFPTQKLPWDEWVELWTEKRGSALGGVQGQGDFTIDVLRGGMPPLDFLKNITVLNDTATKPVLSGLPRPEIDSMLIETYARHWYARGWLPRSPSHRRLSADTTLEKGPLQGLVAVVTGASSGIGAAVVSALVAEGVHVVMAARRVSALETVSSKLQTKLRGNRILIHQTDVTKKEQVESLMRYTQDQLGPVDILISCAGVMYFTLMANVQSEQWEQTVDVNCKGLLHCLSSVLPSMLSRKTGHIVAVSSDAGRKVFPGLGIYSASKFFVEATLQALRIENANSGLRVTSVQPGNVATDLLGMSTDAEALKQYGEPSGAKVLDPEDVARSIIYALKQPEHVAVNEIMIEPREEPC